MAIAIAKRSQGHSAEKKEQINLQKFWLSIVNITLKLFQKGNMEKSEQFNSKME